MLLNGLTSEKYTLLHMEPLKALADNFVDPSVKHHKHAWYAWTGAALALLAVASGLYFFGKVAEYKPEARAVYFNPSLKAILTYPSAWLPAPEPLDGDGLPRRFEGNGGWFEIGATSGDGVILTEIAASLNSSTSLPFGQNPKITTAQIAGQPGVLIQPTQPGVRQAAAVVTYPQPIQAGLTSYRFLILKMEVSHMTSLLNSLRLVENSTGEVQGLPNIMVYLPPQRAVISSPFSVSGIARVFENNVSLKVLNTKGQSIWTGFVAANAPDVGTWGGFSTTIDLAGAEVAVGERLELQVYQSSAKDGSEIDKVKVPLQLQAIQPTKVVEVYFGSMASAGEDECLKAMPLERHVPETNALARAAVAELLKGPTLQERQAGYFTSLPPDVTINRLAITDGVTEVDFSDTLERGVGGSCRVTAIRNQIIKTLKQFASVKDVVISINGRTEDILQP